VAKTAGDVHRLRQRAHTASDLGITAVITLWPWQPKLQSQVRSSKAEQPRSMVLDLTTAVRKRRSSCRDPARSLLRTYNTNRVTRHAIAGVRRLPLPLRRIARRRHVPGERPLHCVRRIWDAVAPATGPFQAVTRGRIQDHARNRLATQPSVVTNHGRRHNFVGL
jgi:hypothetical protein